MELIHNFKKSINKMESVQRRATKMIYKICKKDYTERLKFFKLPSLEDRRVCGGFIDRQRSRSNTFKFKRDLCKRRYHKISFFY